MYVFLSFRRTPDLIRGGIQPFQMVINSLDSGFHRSDDFLRDHQDVKGNETSAGTKRCRGEILDKRLKT